MGQKREMGIIERKSRKLPDGPLISLTEAINWIVDGDCRDDEYMAEAFRQQDRLNQEKWGNRDGPAWLLPHLELLAKGEEWQFGPDVDEFEREITLQEFSAARAWLQVNGGDAASACKRVKDWCDKEAERHTKYEKCCAMIFDACAGREIELVGIRCDWEKSGPEGQYTPIPYTHFLQPVFHHMGEDGLGELSPATPAELDDAAREAMERFDSRSSYLHVQMQRADAQKLSKRFLNDGEKTAPAWSPRPGRPNKQLKNALYALNQLHPEQVPDDAKLISLTTAVNVLLEKEDKSKVSEATVRRAMDRRREA